MARQPASRSFAAHRLGKCKPLGAEDRRLLRKSPAIVGIDEVGRGALAGPVVVCGVRFFKIPRHAGIRDSKRLSEKRRKQVSLWVREHSDAWVIVEVWPEVIDRINILEATRMAMRAVVQILKRPGDTVVVDAVSLGDGYESVLSPIKADDRYFSVAAASNVAKVHRDGLMVELVDAYPLWDWEHNKGYGTRKHLIGIAEHGRSCLHRRSFRCSPVLP